MNGNSDDADAVRLRGQSLVVAFERSLDLVFEAEGATRTRPITRIGGRLVHPSQLWSVHCAGMKPSLIDVLTVCESLALRPSAAVAIAEDHSGWTDHLRRTLGREPVGLHLRPHSNFPTVGLAGVGRALGVSTGHLRRLRGQGRLPPPDHWEARVPEWLPSTIVHWYSRIDPARATVLPDVFGAQLAARSTNPMTLHARFIRHFGHALYDEMLHQQLGIATVARQSGIGHDTAQIALLGRGTSFLATLLALTLRLGVRLSAGLAITENKSGWLDVLHTRPGHEADPPSPPAGL